jgi:hypothetical protein
LNKLGKRVRIHGEQRVHSGIGSNGKDDSPQGGRFLDSRKIPRLRAQLPEKAVDLAFNSLKRTVDIMRSSFLKV